MKKTLKKVYYLNSLLKGKDVENVWFSSKNGFSGQIYSNDSIEVEHGKTAEINRIDIYFFNWQQQEINALLHLKIDTKKEDLEVEKKVK